MLNSFSRTELIYGADAMEKLSAARVAIFGIGGVGGYTLEALARSGVGQLDLIDDDKVCLTNLNRQIIATRKTVGQYKAEVMRERILEINPDAEVVYSEEKPTRPPEDMSISCRTHCICPPGTKHKCTERRDIPGSVAFVPSIAGLLIAGEVVKDLTSIKTSKENKSK